MKGHLDYTARCPSATGADGDDSGGNSSQARPKSRGEATVGVMVVDDQAVFRRVARAVVEATAGFEPVGDAASGAEALISAGQLHPDLVLMDV